MSLRDEWKGSRRNGQLAHQSNLLLTALRGRVREKEETFARRPKIG